MSVHLGSEWLPLVVAWGQRSHKTPQIVVAVLGQAAAGVTQALYTAVNIL